MKTGHKAIHKPGLRQLSKLPVQCDPETLAVFHASCRSPHSGMSDQRTERFDFGSAYSQAVKHTATPRLTSVNPAEDGRGRAALPHTLQLSLSYLKGLVMTFQSTQQINNPPIDN